MTQDEIQSLRVSSQLTPEGLYNSSSIKVLQITPKGIRFQRCHYSYDGEEFFLTMEALAKSRWHLIEIGSQLSLL